MLLIEAQFEGCFTIGIERQEVEIIIGPAVQHAAPAVNSSVNQAAGGAGVLGLHVVFGVSESNVAVVTENHDHGPRVTLAVQPAGTKDYKECLRRFDRVVVESLL